MLRPLKLEKAFLWIESGPALFVVTGDMLSHNLMTASWTTCLDFGKHPRFALVTGPWNYSYQDLCAQKQCVLAVPTADLVKTLVGVGTCSGRDTDKCARFNLTLMRPKIVQAPLIANCIANIECKVVDHIEKHHLFILEGVAAWLDRKRAERRLVHAVGDGHFVLDGKTLNFRKQMASKLPKGV